MIKKLGVIGGSGLYNLEGLSNQKEISVETPWGKPSDSLLYGTLGDIEIYFLPRHGRGHSILPTEVNSLANICALKMQGINYVVAFSAVGSLKEEIAPRDFVVPNQVFDRTRSRPNTFFGDGIVAHLPFADPFCPELSDFVLQGLEKIENLKIHKGETLICMEGPLFSSRAESHFYRSVGAGIINMSVLPEAKCAREAGMAYSMVCMSTDYDCWKENEEDVSLDMVIGNLMANGDKAKKALIEIARIIPYEKRTRAMDLVKTSIITSPEHQNPTKRGQLKILLPEIFSD